MNYSMKMKSSGCDDGWSEWYYWPNWCDDGQSQRQRWQQLLWSCADADDADAGADVDIDVVEVDVDADGGYGVIDGMAMEHSEM